jgi:hypothetical protein
VPFCLNSVEESHFQCTDTTNQETQSCHARPRPLPFQHPRVQHVITSKNCFEQILLGHISRRSSFLRLSTTMSCWTLGQYVKPLTILCTLPSPGIAQGANDARHAPPSCFKPSSLCTTRNAHTLQTPRRKNLRLLFSTRWRKTPYGTPCRQIHAISRY